MVAAARVLRVLEASRHRRRAGGRPGRVPLRRDRRAVPRPSPSCGPPGCSGRGSWSSAGQAPAEQRQHAVTSRPMMSSVRPLGQHAAHHRRRLRRDGRRRRRRHRAALRPPPGPARRLRPPHRPQPDGAADSTSPTSARSPTRPAAPGRSSGSPTTSPWPAGTSSRPSRAAPRSTRRSPPPSPSATEQVATRRRPITGLTEFPNLAETLPERDGEPDDVRRYGAAFEALRDEPAATPVFLATLGPVAAHTARATFATNLFAAGGIAWAAGPTATPTVLAAYDGQPVVCLAGTDAAYDEWGADLRRRASARPGRRHVSSSRASRASGRRRLLRDGRRRAGLPAPDAGGAGMSVPRAFAGLPFTPVRLRRR